MNSGPEQDYRFMTILGAALRLSAAERSGYLRLACQDDEGLFREIEEAVEWEERMGTFLKQPLIALQVFEEPFSPGQVVNERFEIVRKIGEGGMGVVYEAFDRRRNQRIAIKSAKTGFRRLLSPELESALKVRHPNICLVNEIHTAATDHGEVDFLTMEFLDGQTLAGKLASSGPLDQKSAREVARQLCAGLAEAHRSGVIHRDLKSANIFLSQSANGAPRAVIMDFGLAGDHGLGALAGTPRYMAPELWRGEGPSKASDIYALGVVLYEIVTGSEPFADEPEGSRLTTSLTARPSPPSRRARSLDSSWDAAILQCLDPSPAARPAGAAQVAALLDKRPLRKWPLVAAALLAGAALVPAVREPVVGYFRPASVRLAMLPAEGPPDVEAVSNGALMEVADRIRRSQRFRSSVIVIAAPDALRNNVHTAEQAHQILHATHVLQVWLRRESGEWRADASVIDEATRTHVRDFSGRYSAATLGDFPGALAGAVSVALRLHDVAPSDSVSAAAAESYGQGLYFLRRDRYSFEAAIDRFKEAARLDPHSPLPQAGLAESQVLKYKVTKDKLPLEDARSSLQAAEALNPDSVSVRLASGLLNEAQGNYTGALRDYERVLEIAPNNVDALLRAGDAHSNLRSDDKAVESYEKAMALDPGYYEPYMWLGSFYYRRSRYREAAEQFQKAIDAAPGLYDAYINLGAVMDDMGQHDKAEKALKESLKIKETARAMNSLGVSLAYQGKDAEAIQYYRRAVELEKGNYLYWLNLGDAERRQQRPADARTAYLAALDLTRKESGENPNAAAARAFVAYSEVRLDGRARAKDEISRALYAAPQDGRVMFCAVLIYEALRERDRSLEILRLAPVEMLRLLARHPDLKDLGRDPRFRMMLENQQNGG